MRRGSVAHAGQRLFRRVKVSRSFGGTAGGDRLVSSVEVAPVLRDGFLEAGIYRFGNRWIQQIPRFPESK